MPRSIRESLESQPLSGLVLHRSPGGSLLACARRAPFSSRQLGSEVEPAVEEEVPDVAVDENPGRHFGPRWTLSQRNAFTSLAVTSVLRAHELIPRECLRDLACDPVRGRMRSDVDPDEVSWLFKIQALREIPRRALASQRIPPDNRILSAPLRNELSCSMKRTCAGKSEQFCTDAID